MIALTIAAVALGMIFLVGKVSRKKRRREIIRAPSPVRRAPSAPRDVREWVESVESWEQISSSNDSDSDSDLDVPPIVAARHNPHIRSRDHRYGSSTLEEELVIDSPTRDSVKGKGRAIPITPQNPIVFSAITDLGSASAPLPARGEGCKGPDLECTVCSEIFPAEEFLKNITLTCNHKVSTCRACVGQWIRTSLQSRAWDDIKCAECKETCRYEDMTRIAPLDILDA